MNPPKNKVNYKYIVTVYVLFSVLLFMSCCLAMQCIIYHANKAHLNWTECFISKYVCTISSAVLKCVYMSVSVEVCVCVCVCVYVSWGAWILAAELVRQTCVKFNKKSLAGAGSPLYTNYHTHTHTNGTLFFSKLRRNPAGPKPQLSSCVFSWSAKLFCCMGNMGIALISIIKHSEHMWWNGKFHPY